MPYYSDTYKQSPVRAELEGIYYDNNNIRTNFKTTHDYHEFNSLINGNWVQNYFEVNSYYS